MSAGGPPSSGHLAELRPVRLTFGIFNQSAPWTDQQTLSWPQLVSLLTSHQTGPKEGSCVVPAIFRGTRRHKADADQIDVVFLDSDSGATLEEIVAAVRAKGWAAVISSTHSHGTTRTTVRRTAWEKFARGEQGREAALLIGQKGLKASIARDARIVEESADTVTFEHQPCPKFRIALPLLRPWVAADYANQGLANAAWKERIEALAGALSLEHDQACTDTSRLFYLPRSPQGGVAPETISVDGAPCDLFGLAAHVAPQTARKSRLSAPREAQPREMLLFTDAATGEVIDLIDWARAHGSRFKIAAALAARRPDVLTSRVVDRTKVHLECVNADAHTTTHADAATFIMDAGTSSNGGFVYHCRHAHCDGRDRLQFLRQMLERGWLAVADLTDPAFLIAPIDTAPAAGQADGTSNAGPEDGSSFLLTEHGVAQEFARRHGQNLRYCHDTGAWFRWTGHRWQQDKTKLAFHWARHLSAELSRPAPFKTKAVTGKAAFAGAVERFAQADRTFAVMSEIWDADPFLLGTPTGVVDLRTGKLRKAERKDYITRQAMVAPDFSGGRQLWDRFLAEATLGDTGLQRFLQQVAGYCLTGDVREHALFFVYGPGGNGKSVFLNVLTGLMGDYATTAAMDTFTASVTDKHPTDLAMLKGARVVSASETEEGRAWAESRIKQMTGGDPIRARFMRQDFFEYRPQFKLIIVGNHKPVLRNVDDAARRRFNIIPFVHKPQAPDRQLEQKLRAEWPAILAWAIEGASDWLNNGLVRPAVVAEATNEYFTEQDSVRQWVEECCDTGGRGLCATTAALFASWSVYAMANGEKPGSAKWFSQILHRHGYEPVTETPGHRKKRGFLRIAVKNVDTSAQWQNRMEAEHGVSF